MYPYQPASIPPLSTQGPLPPFVIPNAIGDYASTMTAPDASNSNSAGLKVRGTVQIRATTTQTAKLLAEFNACEVAYAPLLERLERETGLPRKWIANWYSRQRAKKKAAEKLQSTATAAPVASGSAFTGDMPAAPASVTGLEVKREAYETAMAPQGTAVSRPGLKKRQAKAQSPAKKNAKKRKVAALQQEPQPQVQGGGHAATANTAAYDLMTRIISGPAYNVPPLHTSGSSATITANLGTGFARSVPSLFEKMNQVKMERYTPPPDALFLSNMASAAAPSFSDNSRQDLVVAVSAMTQQTRPQLAVRSGSLVAQAMNNPMPRSSGEQKRRRGRPKRNNGVAVPNTAVVQNQPANSNSHRIVAALPKRLDSPSDVAMKSRRQREPYAGEGPVMRTQWQNHTSDSFQGVDHTQAVPSSSTVWNSAVRTATNFDYNAGQFYAPFPMVNQPLGRVAVPTQFPVPLHSSHVPMAYQGRIQASYAAPAGANLPALPPPGNGIAQAPPQARPVELLTGRAPGQHFQISGQANAHAINGQSGLIFPRVYAAPEEYCAETEWLRGFQEHLEQVPDEGSCDAWPPSFFYRNESREQLSASPDAGRTLNAFDPLHAPLKHLTDIVTPFCDSLGVTYDKLADLDRERKQIVIDQLLDEEMGTQDPFKAAMGLVMASKLGLRWEE